MKRVGGGSQASRPFSGGGSSVAVGASVVTAGASVASGNTQAALNSLSYSLSHPAHVHSASVRSMYEPLKTTKTVGPGLGPGPMYCAR